MPSAEGVFMRDASSLFGQFQVCYPFVSSYRPTPSEVRLVVLPSEVKLAGPMGFEPTTSDVTGRRSNRAELRPRPKHSFVHGARSRHKRATQMRHAGLCVS